MKFIHYIFGHQGGWDEILLVVAPLGLMAWLLRAANRRAGKMSQDEKLDFAAENDSSNPDA